jgi:hypothetical protein
MLPPVNEMKGGREARLHQSKEFSRRRGVGKEEITNHETMLVNPCPYIPVETRD